MDMKIILLSALLGCLCFVQSEHALKFETTYQISHDEHVSYTKTGTNVIIHRKKRVAPLLVVGAVAGVAAVGNLAVGIYSAVQAANQFEKQMGLQQEQLCQATCVKEWEMWTSCSKLCGGGIKERIRKPRHIEKCNKYDCPHGLKQLASCNQGCPNGGMPKEESDIKSRDGCKCQDGWGGTCCTSPVRCKHPGRPLDGKVQLTTPVLYAAVAMFSCNEGYHLDGDDMLECQVDGTWSHSGLKPKCTEMTCNRPKEEGTLKILNRQTNFTYGESLVYRCPRGHELIGPKTRKCIKRSGSKGRWDGFQPYCSAIYCGDPGVIDKGSVTGSNFTFGGVVTCSCDVGYKRMGPETRRCLSSGKWQGRMPECIQITCEAPFVPKNGVARVKSRSRFGALAVFSCDPGYVLEGNIVLRCQSNGQWNGTEPNCKASLCIDPGVPENGAKDGNVYYYPSKVTYSCYTGYILQGQTSITCQSNGMWSSMKPKCEACPMNYYMNNIESPGVCTRCPEFTHTLTNASTSQRQCVCMKGYTGLPGGPCTEIRCPTLYAPMNGSIDDCKNKMGDSCSFSCVAGYIIDRGSSIRTCQENGEWDGAEPKCAACPLNTYKTDEGSCFPCPKNSNTGKTIGNIEEGCVCDDGYQGNKGGPCTDVDECVPNGGKGPCEDLCDNIVGSYKCGCSIPGYKLSEDDDHTCEVDKQCKNFTTDEAPGNGGLVCNWFNEQNAQQCSVRCNKGYEFPSGINSYETCGPSTNFKWSHQQTKKDARIPSCIPEMFPGYRAEADIFYFTKACTELTDADKQFVYQRFKEVLDKKKVCKRGKEEVCNIKNMGIICGRNVTVRTKRGTLEEISTANIGFDIKSIKIGEDPRKDCPRICAFLKIHPDECSEDLCVRAYKRFIRAAVIVARGQVRRLYQKTEEMNFNAAGRDFLSTTQLNQGDVAIDCDPGMKGNATTGWCVPCAAGSSWNATMKDCQLCPPGTYQPVSNQTKCHDCPIGSATIKPGSYFCEVCPKGKFGKNCGGKCDCAHGICLPHTGQCLCESGWSGAKCDRDIDGCSEKRCFRGVNCTDIPAPGVGFSCGSCPAGFRGNGVKCELISEL